QTPVPRTSSPSLHDALPISVNPLSGLRKVMRRTVPLSLSFGWAGSGLLNLLPAPRHGPAHPTTMPLDTPRAGQLPRIAQVPTTIDRKSTRLNSSHVKISYAV